MDLSDQRPRISAAAAASATDYTCEECNHNFFIPVFQLKKISAIMSPTGQEINFPVQTFGCAKCGHVNAAFLPKLNETA